MKTKYAFDFNISLIVCGVCISIVLFCSKFVFCRSQTWYFFLHIYCFFLFCLILARKPLSFFHALQWEDSRSIIEEILKKPKLISSKPSVWEWKAIFSAFSLNYFIYLGHNFLIATKVFFCICWNGEWTFFFLLILRVGW